MNIVEPQPRVATRGWGSRFHSRTSELGASAVEYGLMIAGVAALIVVIVFAFGDNIRDVLFNDTCQEMVDTGGIGDCV